MFSRIHKTVLALSSVVLLSCGLVANAQNYDADTGFSVTNNPTPDGVWRYD